MKKYIYGLGLGVIPAVAITYAVFGSVMTPNKSTVESNLRQDAIDFEVETRGWLGTINQGELSNPDYRAVMSKDISSMSAKVSSYQKLFAEMNR